LSVEKALTLPSVAKAIGRCKLLVSHFNHLLQSLYVLQQKQYDLKNKQHYLVQNVATRWNSSYYMVQQVLEQQQPSSVALLQLKRGDLIARLVS